MHEFNYIDGVFVLDLPNYVRIQVFSLENNTFKWEFRASGKLLFCGVRATLKTAKETALFIVTGDK